MGVLRSRRLHCVSIAVVAVVCTLYLLGLWTGPGRPGVQRPRPVPPSSKQHVAGITDNAADAHAGDSHAAAPAAAATTTTTTFNNDADAANAIPPPARGPRPAPPGQHPVAYLISKAQEEMAEMRARQSRTLSEAVAEYRRRSGGVPPPPNFDKWWALAQARDVQLVDEFDTVAEMLTPFWGLSPATIRGRAAEALGFAGNFLLGVQIRRGRVAHIAGGSDWHRKAIAGMLESFVEHLPDMDLAFNVHDEPRVAVPHDDMARLVHRAKTGPLAAAAALSTKPRNSFSGRGSPGGSDKEKESEEEQEEEKEGGEGHGRSRRPRPAGLAPDGGFDALPTTRFNTYAHQSTWQHSRAACGPETPARALDDGDAADDLSAALLGDLGFVYNVTALSDVCASPSLATSFGFFERPNSFSVVQELFPVFSASKVSTYADILYPSPWYWYEKVAYDEAQDPPWDQKKPKLYWRGSTTGGFSRNGGWRRQHRQRMVDHINGADGEPARILVPPTTGAQGGGSGDPTQATWRPDTAPHARFAPLVDVAFSHVGQCDPADCEAQRRHFDVKARAQAASAWQHRHLLDVDGNGFSGRFHALLRSRSLVHKLALFREWHADWLRPWAHYVPWSLRGHDWLELLRFLAPDGPADHLARRVADDGRDWAAKVLRNEDLEVWFFRLLLEYGRVVDDDREKIGYSQ